MLGPLTSYQEAPAFTPHIEDGVCGVTLALLGLCPADGGSPPLYRAAWG